MDINWKIIAQLELTIIKFIPTLKVLSYYYLTLYSVVHLSVTILVALTLIRGGNSHRNSLAMQLKNF